MIEHIITEEDHKGCCPECGSNWDGGDIYEYFLDVKNNPTSEGYAYYKDKTDAEIMASAESYGYRPNDKKHFSKLIGIELPYNDPDHYDGISYWQCPECMVAWNRFNGKRTERFKDILTNAK